MSAGHGTRSDVRKRLEAQHQAHPDPAVCELLAKAWREGYQAGALGEYRFDLTRNPYETP